MMTTEGQPSGPAVTVALAAIGGLGMNSTETHGPRRALRRGHGARAELRDRVCAIPVAPPPASSLLLSCLQDPVARR